VISFLVAVAVVVVVVVVVVVKRFLMIDIVRGNCKKVVLCII
jgi:hypothetical protein